MQQLYTWYGRQVDAGRKTSTSSQRNASGTPITTATPIFCVGRAANDDQRDRVIGNLTPPAL